LQRETLEAIRDWRTANVTLADPNHDASVFAEQKTTATSQTNSLTDKAKQLAHVVSDQLRNALNKLFTNASGK